MKAKKLMILVFSVIAVFSFSSCNDNDRRNEDEQMRNDSIRMAEENRLEQERMDWENNSVFAMVQEDTALTTFSHNLESNQLSETFQEEEGPFTVFAPSNVAYHNLSQEERDSLTDPQNMEENSARMFYLVVDEELTEEELRQEIEAANGTYTLTTMQGEEITASVEGGEVVLSDGTGNKARIVATPMDASNGMVHVIDAILEPTDVSINEAGQRANYNNNRTDTSTNDTTSTKSGGM